MLRPTLKQHPHNNSLSPIRSSTSTNPWTARTPQPGCKGANAAGLAALPRYESAYEGDSYTIAFHTAQSAVQFALAVQKALLTVDWPLQLLEQAELCRPFIVLPAAASSQLPAFHPAALAAGSSTFASMPLAMRLSLASRPEQPTVTSYLRRLRPSQDMYFNRSTQSLELGPRNEPQQPSSATALPNQAAQHTLYASPTALVSPATLKPAMVSAPSTGCGLSGPFTVPSGQAGQAGDACTSNYLSASTNTTLDEADLFSAAEAFLTSNSRWQYDGTSPAAWSMQPSALLKGWPGSNGVSESDHGAFCDAAPLTLHQHLLRSTAVVPSGTAGSLLLFRGLRVARCSSARPPLLRQVLHGCFIHMDVFQSLAWARACPWSASHSGGSNSNQYHLCHRAHAPPGWKHITVCAHAAAGVAGPARGPGGDACRAARFEGGQGA
ncbi:guanylate cyclase domain-containing protein [Haematococcus lacustris]|uniref:Guanylate cyclase domain-containing protein n=1 Tax=Haematococcus lacustris TaxID=44745 RepID=A0A699ZCL8_HAELA|nr:guanylate cyclase domain-containing protein [Haematococcus lacustris]